MSSEIMTWSLLLSVIAIGLPLFYFFQVAKRKQKHLKYKARRIAVYLVVGSAVFFVLRNLQYSRDESALVGILAGATAAFVLVSPPRRSRQIPRRVRDFVIERDLKGLPFDSSQYEIDHIVPFSRGGDHSTENLRVIRKVDNRRRGARMPSLRDFLGHQTKL